MRAESVHPDWLCNKTIVVIDTNQPVDWHFADNLCAYCIGIGGKDTEDAWKKLYFEEMHINSDELPYFKDDRMFYPNPFEQPIWKTMTNRGYMTPCTPFPNPNYGNNGFYNYVDYREGTTLNGDLFDPLSIIVYDKPAYMSVALFFIKKLHYLLLSVIEARAKRFCSLYPNSVSGKFHKVEAIRYEQEPLQNIKTNQTPQGIQRTKVEIEEVANTL